MKLAKNLRKYRQRSHFTQSKLANRLHVSRKTISNWENGRSQPSFETLDALSKIYKTSTDALLHGKVKKTSKKVIISYYLNVILFILNIIMDIFIKDNITHVITMILLLINLVYLFINYKHWNLHFIKEKTFIISILIISFIFSIIDSSIYVQIEISPMYTIRNNYIYFIGSFTGSVSHILIMTISFFMILLLSKNLQLLFNKKSH